jgi:hypothetical protein
MCLRIAAGLVCATWLAAQGELPREVVLLGRIKQHMRERLQQVPNYTCLETVERMSQQSSAAKVLFIQDTTRFTYAGEDEIDGRKLVRYDYQVALPVSGYWIIVGNRKAVVGYHGSFWSDPQTLDTYHFRLIAEDIPPELGVTDAGVDVDYQSVEIRGAGALLPKRADFTITESAGARLRNITTFSNCKHYGSESVLTFDSPKQ